MDTYVKYRHSKLSESSSTMQLCEACWCYSVGVACPRERPRQQEIDTFFRQTYFSVAETMPHGVEMAGHQDTNPKEFQKLLVEAVLDAACVNPVEQSTRREPRRWAVRYLPPGKLADLYLMYAAWARGRGLDVASAWTFRVVWKTAGWKECLIFRGASTHALCFTCGQLRAKIASADTVDMHVQACSTLHAHLRDQYRDREVYWALRTRARTEKDVISLIGDGMDKSKFGLPQWSDGRAPKHAVVDKNPRPSCNLYAVMAHGWRVDVYITHEGVSTGPSYCTDMLLRTLDQVWKQSQRAGVAFPFDCVIQGDNTTKELKNSILGRTLGLLSLAGVFRSCGHMHLRVGHTHEDVDQFFGLVARMVYARFIKQRVARIRFPGKLELCELVGHVRRLCLHGRSRIEAHIAAICQTSRAKGPTLSERLAGINSNVASHRV